MNIIFHQYVFLPLILLITVSPNLISKSLTTCKANEDTLLFRSRTHTEDIYPRYLKSEGDDYKKSKKSKDTIKSEKGKKSNPKQNKKGAKKSDSKVSKKDKKEKSGTTDKNRVFNRISTFSVCEQIEPHCDTSIITAAETVTVTDDGMTLIYNDVERNAIGFVDISDPETPSALGVVQLEGYPSSVSYINGYAVAAIVDNTKYDHHVLVINVETRKLVKKLSLYGRPQKIIVSPDTNYIAVTQQQSALLFIIDSSSSVPNDWSISTIDISRLDGLESTNEPRAVNIAINKENIAVITIQNKNGLALIDLKSGKVSSSFSAGTINLDNIDTVKDSPRKIDQSSSLKNIARSPDGVAFIGEGYEYFATADEGSRSFSIFSVDGDVVYNSGSEMDQIAVSVGHYDDKKSGSMGIRSKNLAFGSYGNNSYLFVTAEEAGLVYVYDVSQVKKPKFKQVLPVGIFPQVVIAIPHRNLFVVASSLDSRDNAIRSSISFYNYTKNNRSYPSLMSKRDSDTGVAIPWAGISGLTAGKGTSLWAVSDFSHMIESRIYEIETKETVNIIVKAINIVDSNNVLANFPTNDFFNKYALNAMINSDGTVNLDAEGIAHDGENFWICTEAGQFNEDPRRINFVFKIDSRGVILDVFTLPDSLLIAARDNSGKGLEGIAYGEGHIIVTMQWPLKYDKIQYPLVLRYNIEEQKWVDNGIYYPTDTPESQNDKVDTWVGINDITYNGDGVFYVMERDNQAGLDAAIKRIYSIEPLEYSEGEILKKKLVKDLIADGDLPIAGGLIYENPEGLAVTGNGVWLVNDNDAKGIATFLTNLGII